MHCGWKIKVLKSLGAFAELIESRGLFARVSEKFLMLDIKLCLTIIFFLYGQVSASECLTKDDKIKENVYFSSAAGIQSYQRYLERFLESLSPHKSIQVSNSRCYTGQWADDACYSGVPAAIHLQDAYSIIELSSDYLDPVRMRTFLSNNIFKVAKDVKRAKLKSLKQNRSIKMKGSVTGSSDEYPWIPLFEHPIMREAFTICASAVTESELFEMLVDYWESFFPLLVCNYEAASQFNSWPFIEPSRLCSIFVIHSLGADFEKCQRGQMSNGTKAATMSTLFYSSFSTLGLSAFKLPNFLAGLPLDTIKFMLKACKYNLSPFESDVLHAARGGSEALFRELSDEPHAWLLLRTLLAKFPMPPLADVNLGLGQATTVAGPSIGKAKTKSKPERKKVCLPPPPTTYPSESLEYAVDAAPLIAAIEDKVIYGGGLGELPIPCIHYLLSCNLTIYRLVLFLTLVVSNDKLSLPASVITTAENELEKALTHYAAFACCVSQHPTLIQALPTIPLGGSLCHALVEVFSGKSLHSSTNNMVIAIYRFINRSMKNLRFELLKIFMGSFASEHGQNNRLNAALAWNAALCRSHMNFGAFSVLVLYLIFDDYDSESELNSAQSAQHTPYAAIKQAWSGTFLDIDEVRMLNLPPMDVFLGQPIMDYPLNFLPAFASYCQAKGLANFLKMFASGSSPPCLDISIVRGLFDELGFDRVECQRSSIDCQVSIARLHEAVQYLITNLGDKFKLLAPVFTKRQMLAILDDRQSDISTGEDSKTMRDYFFQPSVYLQMRSVAGLDIAGLGIDCSRLFYSLHTVPCELLLANLAEKEWIVSDPILFMTSCHSKLWAQPEFTSQIWELSSASILMHFCPKAVPVDLVQALIVEPLQARMTLCMRTSDDIKGCIWLALKYMIMRDYEFRVVNIVEIMLLAGKGPAHPTVFRDFLKYLLPELGIRHRISHMLQHFEIDAVINDEADSASARNIKSDFEWLFRAEKFSLLLSKDRLTACCTHFTSLDPQPGPDSPEYLCYARMERFYSMDTSNENDCKALEDIVEKDIARIAEMIDWYAPSAAVAHVWKVRLNICGIPDVLHVPINSNSRICDLGLPPKWLKLIEADGSVPAFDALIARLTSKHFTAIMIKAIQSYPSDHSSNGKFLPVKSG